MSTSRVIRKQNIIAWSHQQLTMLVEKARAQNKMVPPVILDTIQKLAYFGGIETEECKIIPADKKANWADFQSNPKSLEWLHDLALIDNIRTALITYEHSFMRQEASKKHLYDADFYNVIEAMLLGFTEQWPANDFNQINDIHVPMCGLSNYSLTTLKEEVSRQNEFALAFLTMQGKQIDYDYVREECFRLKKISGCSHLNLNDIPDRSQFPFLPRDNRNFNGEKALSILTPEEKIRIKHISSFICLMLSGSAGLLILFLLVLGCIYIPSTTVSVSLLYGTIISMSAVGVLGYSKMESLIMKAAMKIATYFKTSVVNENNKIAELFNILNTHPDTEVSKINPALSTTAQLNSSLSQEQKQKRQAWLDRITTASQIQEMKSSVPSTPEQPLLEKTLPKPPTLSAIHIQREEWLSKFKAPTALENQRLEDAQLNNAVNRRGCHII